MKDTIVQSKLDSYAILKEHQAYNKYGFECVHKMPQYSTVIYVLIKFFNEIFSQGSVLDLAKSASICLSGRLVMVLVLVARGWMLPERLRSG